MFFLPSIFQTRISVCEQWGLPKILCDLINYIFDEDNEYYLYYLKIGTICCYYGLIIYLLSMRRYNEPLFVHPNAIVEDTDTSGTYHDNDGDVPLAWRRLVALAERQHELTQLRHDNSELCDIEEENEIELTDDSNPTLEEDELNNRQADPAFEDAQKAKSRKEVQEVLKAEKEVEPKPEPEPEPKAVLSADPLESSNARRSRCRKRQNLQLEKGPQLAGQQIGDTTKVKEMLQTPRSSRATMVKQTSPCTAARDTRPASVNVKRSRTCAAGSQAASMARTTTAGPDQGPASSSSNSTTRKVDPRQWKIVGTPRYPSGEEFKSRHTSRRPRQPHTIADKEQ